MGSMVNLIPTSGSNKKEMLFKYKHVLRMFLNDELNGNIQCNKRVDLLHSEEIINNSVVLSK